MGIRDLSVGGWTPMVAGILGVFGLAAIGVVLFATRSHNPPEPIQQSVGALSPECASWDAALPPGLRKASERWFETGSQDEVRARLIIDAATDRLIPGQQRDELLSVGAKPHASDGVIRLLLEEKTRDYPVYESVDTIEKLVDNFRHAALACMEPGQTVIIVEGLPDVSGFYKTANGNVAVSGFATHGYASLANIGRCFVNDDGHPFETKAVVSAGTEEFSFRDLGSADALVEYLGVDYVSEQLGDEFLETSEGIVTAQAGLFITVDVGISGSGDAFATVVGEIVKGDSEYGVSPSFVTHVYEPALYHENAEVIVHAERVPEVDNAFGGIAVFSSTSYNERNYLPWTDADWRGSPLYGYTITVLCTAPADFEAPPDTTTTTTTTTVPTTSDSVLTANFGDHDYSFTFTGAPGEVCDPDQNGFFVVNVSGFDEDGRAVELHIEGSSLNGVGSGELRVGELRADYVDLTVDGSTMSGTGLFVDFSDSDGVPFQGSFSVTC